MVLEQPGVDYSNTFAPTPAVSSIKVALAIVVQNDWSLYHFGVKQAFVQAKLDTDFYMKLPYGCGERTGKVVKLNRALYRIKQAGRQWSANLCQTLADDHGMEQGRVDPCVYRKIVKGVVKLILVLIVHMDDILVLEKKEACGELHHTLNENSRPKISGS